MFGRLWDLHKYKAEILVISSMVDGRNDNHGDKPSPLSDANEVNGANEPQIVRRVNSFKYVNVDVCDSLLWVHHNEHSYLTH